MSEYDVGKARDAQNKYCIDNHAPHFAPDSGTCWSCRRNIYSQVGWKNERNSDGFPIRSLQIPLDSIELEYTTGVTVEKAANELITGCPHCNRSYCD